MSDEYVVANLMLSKRLIFNTLVITMLSLRFTPQSKFTVQCLMPAFENQLKTNSVCTFTSLHSYIDSHLGTTTINILSTTGISTAVNQNYNAHLQRLTNEGINNYSITAALGWLYIYAQLC